MLNKAMAVILDSDEPDCPRIANQANSAFAMLMLRMLSGRLYEAWKLLASFSKTLKADYEPSMGEEAREALKRVRAYFSPRGKKHSLIHDVRDNVAFHSLREAVEGAYTSLPDTDDLGDYLHRSIGNTLYFTIEILHYETLKNLANAPDYPTALRMLVSETHRQTSDFNAAIYGFALVFCKRFLPEALNGLSTETEVIPGRPFHELKLPFFSQLSQAPNEI